MEFDLISLLFKRQVKIEMWSASSFIYKNENNYNNDEFNTHSIFS